MEALTIAVERSPFPHAVVDDMWPDRMLFAVRDEWPASHAPWRRYDNEHERKAEGGPHLWGEATRQLLALMDRTITEPGVPFPNPLQLGIPGLVMRTEGGGLHMIEAGGYLHPHVDFDRSPEGLYRRVNVLVFLTDAGPQDGGGLNLYGDSVALVIPPRFNRTVIFECSNRSWHGHPDPWRGSEPRRSVAAYFFSPEPAPGSTGDGHSTIWMDDAR